MRLIDADNIDYVILEDSLHRIEHKKGDEIDCVIGAEIVQAIPLDKFKQAREEIQKCVDVLSDDTLASLSMKSGLGLALEKIDKLIESEEK